MGCGARCCDSVARAGTLEFLKGMHAAQGGSGRKCLLKPAVLIFKCVVAAGCDVAGSFPRRPEGHLLRGTAQIRAIGEIYKGKPKRSRSSAAPGSFVVSECKESGFPHESFTVEQT